MVDLQGMSVEELKEAQSAIEAELLKRASKEKAEARRKILELANAHQINLSELVTKERMYRNPDNHLEVWSGKGRKPNWIKRWLEKGKDLEDFAVP